MGGRVVRATAKRRKKKKKKKEETTQQNQLCRGERAAQRRTPSRDGGVPPRASSGLARYQRATAGWQVTVGGVGGGGGGGGWA